MSTKIFYSGSNFHIQKNDSEYTIFFEENGEYYKAIYLDGEISQKVKVGEFNEIVYLSDNRKLKRIDDLSVIYN